MPIGIPFTGGVGIGRIEQPVRQQVFYQVERPARVDAVVDANFAHGVKHFHCGSDCASWDSPLPIQALVMLDFSRGKWASLFNSLANQGCSLQPSPFLDLRAVLIPHSLPVSLEERPISRAIN